MDEMTRKLALAEIRRLKSAYAEYEAECQELAKQGFRPSHCFHGTCQWVDYDPMCHECEMGATLYDLALARAHAIVTDRLKPMLDMFSTACTLRVHGMDAIRDKLGAMLMQEWNRALGA